MSSVCAPAWSNAFRGSVISTCSKPSVTKMATRDPSSCCCMIVCLLSVSRTKPHSSGARRLNINAVPGDFGQLFIRRGLLVECLFEQGGRALMAHLLGISAHRSVRGHFVMLPALARGNDGGVAHCGGGVFPNHFIALLEYALHALALLLLSLLAV